MSLERNQLVVSPDGHSTVRRRHSPYVSFSKNTGEIPGNLNRREKIDRQILTLLSMRSVEASSNGPQLRQYLGTSVQCGDISHLAQVRSQLRGCRFSILPSLRSLAVLEQPYFFSFSLVKNRGVKQGVNRMHSPSVSSRGFG